ncbi:Brix-domain-containing protein [Atractiella rhizophila]|nr:Brix-domain-containing protein [Atractiella rhizophila]
MSDIKIKNPQLKNSIVRQERRVKSKSRLTERLQRKAAEKSDPKLRHERLKIAREGGTRTVENTKSWIGEEGGIDAPIQLKEDEEMDLGELTGLVGEGGGRILLTTDPPRPIVKEVRQFLKELTGMWGGEERVDCRPRKDGRWELKKVCGWAEKRGYGAIVIVGLDKRTVSSLTFSVLPTGPTAFFRLTSVRLSKQIHNHANPTPHPPDLVLSNFSTPLGLTVGMMLRDLFPRVHTEEDLKKVTQGRQVVYVGCSRDFIFFRRFRYMFEARSEFAMEASKKKEKYEGVEPEDGETEDLRTVLQEIGPRFTLKLRWLRREPLYPSRFTNGASTSANVIQVEEGREEGGNMEMGGEDKEIKEAMKESGNVDDEQMAVGDETEVDNLSQPEAVEAQDPATDSSSKLPRKRKRSSIPKSERPIRIPEVRGGLAAFNKVKDEHERKKAKREKLGRENMWEWKPRMQVDRKKGFM